MVDRFQRAALATRLQIPMIYGIDAVHGDGNMVGATIFPHNIGLGATRDPALVRRRSSTSPPTETRASGIRVGLRAVPVRGPRRPLGPHLRVASARTRRW